MPPSLWARLEPQSLSAGALRCCFIENFTTRVENKLPVTCCVFGCDDRQDGGNDSM